MKKVYLILSCCAFIAACNSNSSTTNEGSLESASADSASSSAMSAATRQSDADTSSMNIGTDRTAGTGTSANPHEKGAQLIATLDCTGCHKIDQKILGPAYEAVAQKYENNEKDTKYLAGKIIKGGSGVWGQVAMPAHPGLSQEDAEEMAKYILSLKK